MPDRSTNQVQSAGPRLEVLCGPMFAGKSTELLRRIAEAEGHGISVIVFKPDGDRRYHARAVVTHSGISREARPIADATEMLGAVGSAAVVGIDEAHFFGAGLNQVCDELLRAGKRVIVAGLERDHRGLPFEPFPILLCEADEVVKLASPCAACGALAVHSQRMVNTPGRIVVGGAGLYEARCRACFRPAARL